MDRAPRPKAEATRPNDYNEITDLFRIDTAEGEIALPRQDVQKCFQTVPAIDLTKVRNLD